jgi:hypothetical protein
LVDRLAEKFSGFVNGNLATGEDFARKLAVTEIAVALRRFKIDHGEYPVDLSPLVATYLDVIPIDPYTGRPPIYARQGTGFSVDATGSRPEVLGWRIAVSK